MQIDLLPPNKTSPRRIVRNASIEPLAVLPVFYRLHGESVLVAGGSDAAAWKAELLAAAGATVHVYAAAPGEVLGELLAAAGDSGSYVHHARPWAPDSFSGKSIAICDAGSEAEAQSFHSAGRAAGTPVNVIDKPDHCDFQFGSIVNRSPAVIGISTDGAAPVLGQSIRRRIEAVLPNSLARWADLAKQLRATVARSLQPGPQRRKFWEHFADRAFSGEPSCDAFAELIGVSSAIARSSSLPAGRVTFIGAGPGDPELLTLKAVRCLQSADVILFDDIVSADVLELARREARRIAVNSLAGSQIRHCEDIVAMMSPLAQSGKNIVRLIAGDPKASRNADREIVRLKAGNIAISIVPAVAGT